MSKVVVTLIQNPSGGVLSLRTVSRNGTAVWGLPTVNIAANESGEHKAVQMLQRDTGITCSPEKKIAEGRTSTGTLVEYWSCSAQTGAPRDPRSGPVGEVAYRPVNDFLNLVVGEQFPAPVLDALKSARKGKGHADFTRS
jgi:hypothetical protein